ncbi:MAG: VOC family protein [Burkholderiaceae bacterium]
MNRTDGLTFQHMGIFTTDIEAMTRFYTEVLGMTVADRGQLATPSGPIELVFLSRDPRHHHQIALASGRPRDVSFNVINQISFTVPSVEAMQRFYKRLQSESVDALVAVTHGISFSLYFNDPDGNRIEIYFDTPWYVTQPSRAPLPIELPVDELMRWAEAHARTLEGFRPREEWNREIAQRMAADQEREARTS